MENRKLISIATPCFNEEDNIVDVYNAIKKIFQDLPDYDYEHLFIDNCSTDKTVQILREIADQDKNVKVILNTKNFGHIRSPYYGLLQTTGDASIMYLCDLQDPPELIKDFISKWEEGHNVVIGIKEKNQGNMLITIFRKIFYTIIEKISETDQIPNFTGFGLYDKSFLNVLRDLNDPYPYFRGLVAEFSSSRYEILYTMRDRNKGKSKNNFYTLYDIAMLGFVNHSKVPLRMASFIGFLIAILSIFIAIVYLIYKLMFWSNFQVGVAPLAIGLFFFTSIQLFFIGIIGEYIGSIFTQVKNRPLVIEKERINFK